MRASAPIALGIEAFCRVFGTVNFGLSCPFASNSQASMTLRTTGPATLAPASPFSIMTATTIAGRCAGAKPTKSALSRWRSWVLLRLYRSPCLIAMTCAVPLFPAIR